jgi:plastocyanin
MRRRLCAGLLVVAYAAAAAIAGESLAERETAADAAALTVGDNFFRPRLTAIRRGAAVTWVWRGRRRHNIVFVSHSSGKPRNCRARRAGSCTRRFRRRGSFEYVCTLHGSMAGVVRVRRR